MGPLAGHICFLSSSLSAMQKPSGSKMGNILSASFAPECTEAKNKYDECFNGWYTEKFLKGKSIENECEHLWFEYKECIDLHLHKKGIKKMLDEAEKDLPFANGGEAVSKPAEKK